MDADRPLSHEEVAVARQRRLEAMKLQEIEGNPLTAEEVAMFEMFERERWPHERRRAYLMAKFEKTARNGGD
jgi:Fic family protein